MNAYSAPLKDMRFVMRELADMEQISKLPGYSEASRDTVDAVLDEAARFAGEVLGPLNRSGDREGAKWTDGVVSVPKGFPEAYSKYIENGWNGIGAETAYGGQGMPYILVAAVNEMWKTANMAFSLCPLLTAGAIEAISFAGSQTLKDRFLPKMISGAWSGTMNLTEPQAGSDLSMIRTRAVPHADGNYRIFGQKIFITYGEHDMTENIVHLVLARTPEAPAGVRGISLFVVPKYLVNDDGSLGRRNDLRCVSIEHKLGIHASPTCTMAYGDNCGAVGYLVGKENDGLKYMFVMMNAARFAVGQEGVAMAERAYQQALAFARARVQGRDLADGSGPVPIIRHPDIRRMLMLMKSQIEAMRALSFVVAAAVDIARRHHDPVERRRKQAFVDLMIPVVKGWCTETGVELASLGIQIHGGMGFIEETGAAQHLRDARIATIYEGTTGIQAMDLLGRKIPLDDGAAIKEVLIAMRKVAEQLADQPGDDFPAIRIELSHGLSALTMAATYIGDSDLSDIKHVYAGAVPFLKLLGIVAGGWQLARAALAAQHKIQTGDGDPYLKVKISTARFYAEHVLPAASALSYSIIHGGASTLAVPEHCL